MLGRLLCNGVASGRAGLVELAPEAFCEFGDCTGGIAMGDLARFSDVAPRERLRERPRIRAVMAPKKDSSVGDVAVRELGDPGEEGGDIWPEDDCDFCESTVFVRTGRGMGWLCEVMVAFTCCMMGWMVEVCGRGCLYPS